MAAMWTTGQELLEIIFEYVGHKAGLALTRDELVKHMPQHASELPPSDGDGLRIRHEVVEEMVREVLHNVGALRNPRSGMPPTIALLHKYKRDAEATAIVQSLTEAMIELDKSSAGNGPLDITPMAEKAAARFGRRGLAMFREFYELLQEYLQGSIIGTFRRVEWENIEQLHALFTGEQLEPQHGTFIDQRFIDYLAQNFDAVDRMHWRKFEGLVGEYFDKKGYAVEVGPGRNDDGVDLRVWRRIPTPGDPATLLVQCKKTQDKVGKVVVKALWADMVHEDVPTGLIVTTSALEPGAARTAIARGYKVGRTEREKLRKWIEAMRTPGSGLILAR